MAHFILRPCGHDLHGLTSPFLHKIEPSIGLVYFKILFAFKEYSFHEKLTKNMGPHCTVRLECLLVAFPMALTLEPIRSLCTISTMRLVFLCDGLTQSPSEAMPLDLWEGPGVGFPMDEQSVALWEEVVRKSLCLFTGPCNGLSSSDLVGVQTAS